MDITFKYKKKKLVINCNYDEKIIDACKRFTEQINTDLDTKLIFFNDNQILIGSEETFIDIIPSSSQSFSCKTDKYEIKLIDDASKLYKVSIDYKGDKNNIKKDFNLKKDDNLMTIFEKLKININNALFLKGGKQLNKDDLEKSMTLVADKNDKQNKKVTILAYENEFEENENDKIQNKIENKENNNSNKDAKENNNSNENHNSNENNNNTNEDENNNQNENDKIQNKIENKENNNSNEDAKKKNNSNENHNSNENNNTDEDEIININFLFENNNNNKNLNSNENNNINEDENNNNNSNEIEKDNRNTNERHNNNNNHNDNENNNNDYNESLLNENKNNEKDNSDIYKFKIIYFDLIIQLCIIITLFWLGYALDINKAFIKNIGTILGTFIPTIMFISLISFHYFMNYFYPDNIFCRFDFDEIFINTIIFLNTVFITFYCFLLTEFISFKYILTVLFIFLFNFILIEIYYIIKLHLYMMILPHLIINTIIEVLFYYIWIKDSSIIINISIILFVSILYMIIMNCIILEVEALILNGLAFLNLGIFVPLGALLYFIYFLFSYYVRKCYYKINN